MGRSDYPTTEELIATLRRSHLKNVLIEGKSDLQAYRILEQKLSDSAIDFLPCNGRNTLLQLFKVRDTFLSRSLFICDCDLWVFTGVPDDFQHDCMITTQGYSIENELFQDAKDQIEALLSADEFLRFKKIIQHVCVWFAFEVHVRISDAEAADSFADVTLLSTNVIRANQNTLTEEFLRERNFSPPPEELSDKIKGKSFELLRGKFLMQGLRKIFHERPSEQARYSEKQCVDLFCNEAFRSANEGSIMQTRLQKIEAFFSVDSDES